MEAIGFAGFACSFLYRVPQIIKLYKTKSARDISPWMIHIQNISYIFYTAYGILISDTVYIVSSIVSILQNLIILGLRLKFLKTDQVPIVALEMAADVPVGMVIYKNEELTRYKFDSEKLPHNQQELSNYMEHFNIFLRQNTPSESVLLINNMCEGIRSPHKIIVVEQPPVWVQPEIPMIWGHLTGFDWAKMKKIKVVEGA